ncbi:MAG: hypothetical protein KIT60_13715 [Burkholderiaceae bacterium]|nr:hypothetical protein [Burkholderiaceae bacterium]
MNALLARVIEAHGGMDHWMRHSTLTATIVTGGGLWAMKGLVQEPNPRTMRISLHEQRASVGPFGGPDLRTEFTPHRVAIVTCEGALVQERLTPRDSFSGHTMNTPWDPLHRAYFNGYAMWTYLTTPFFMLMPGFQVREIEPWKEGSETWHGLRVRFPEDVATHSTEQDFYFGPDFLLRRHDYLVDVSGAFGATQYVHDTIDVDGIKYPTRRRAYLRGPDGQPVRDVLLVSIDLSDFRFA